MKAENFAYWLMGYIELADPELGLTPQQLDTVERHLRLVFIHDIDPKAGPKEVQDKLNDVHSPIDVEHPGGIKPIVHGFPNRPVMRC